MIFFNRPRAAFGAAALACLVVLGAAYYEQHGPAQMQPCPFCILQRYVFIGIGLACLIAAIQGPKKAWARVYSGLSAMLSLTGLGIAAYLVTKQSSMNSCLADPVAVFVNGLPTAAWWDDFFWATGGCGTEYPPVLGLTVPVWSLVWFAVLSAYFALILFKKK